ncbi:MAG: methionyl-tRNA formyltransferase [Burkholderiales bacterium]|jgi:methionyl-tRNA formyltransferase|nr:methionyl-tRNA formyltransferase [Burkholderiales bacterium]
MTPSSLRIGFAGTPSFAATILTALIEAGFTPRVVMTQPDRPQGRGLKLTASPVKEVARARDIPVLQPASLRTGDAKNAISALKLDILIVAAYGLVLPADVLTTPKYGCVNVHASLLPRWRGAAPIHRAILAGDVETGVTLMQMDEGLDTGAIIRRKIVPIAPDETTGTLHDKLARAGAQLAVVGLRVLDKTRVLASVPQPTTDVTYANKIGREDTIIDWTKPADDIERAIRAFHPFPGAYTMIDGAMLKIWQAQADMNAPTQAAAGTVVAAQNDTFLIACGKGALSLREIQQAGAKRMSISAFLAGKKIAVGTLCGK